MRRVIVFALLLALALAGAGFRLFRSQSEPEPELAGSLETNTLEHDGRVRSFDVYVPARLAVHPAVVFVLHGSAGDGARARRAYAYGFDRLAERHGFLAVYPDGYERHWNGCRARGPYAANELGVDDVGFLDALVDHLVGEHSADRSRVYATGISNGGHMALRLALEAPGFVRAVAPVAAATPAGDNLGCEPAGKPVSLLLMNGTRDPMNPYEGGEVAFLGLIGHRGRVESTRDTIDEWRRLAGYASDGVRSQMPDLDPDDASVVEVEAWRAPGRKTVVLYTIRGGGHTIPHPRQRMPRILGPTNGDIDASERIWEFFAAAP